MTLKCVAQQITISTAVATSTLTADCGGQPVFVFFWANGRVSNSSGAGNLRRMYGWTDGTHHRVAMSCDQDLATVGETDRSIDDRACVAAIAPGTGDPQTLDGRCSCAFTSTGFTLTIDDAFATAFICNYIAFIGNDITAVSVGTFNAPTSAGTDSTVSLAFDPDVVGLAMIGGATAINNVGVDSVLGFGMAGPDPDTGIIQQWTHCSWSDDGPTTIDAWKYMKSGECIAAANGTTAIDFRGVMTSMTGGFVVDWTEVNGADQPPVIYFALKVGGKSKVGNFLTDTVASTAQTINTSTFRPMGGIFVSACAPESVADTPVAHDELSVGGFGISQLVAYSGSVDNLGTTDDWSALGGALIYLNYSSVASQVLEGQETIQSTQSGSFTIFDAVNDNAANFVGYWVIGATSTLHGPDELGNWYVGEHIKYVDINNVQRDAQLRQVSAAFGDTISLSYLDPSGSTLAQVDVDLVPHSSTVGGGPYWFG